ncbi:MAG TPA: ABC transporter substrate-binding protein [Thermodesulfobacteriota bacterium]|nr:ABC transporter substrate-binding protein [Thermodesulfobacteriota bacterium]
MKRRTLSVLLVGLGVLYLWTGISIAAGKPIEMWFASEMEIASLDPLKSSNNWEWVTVLNIYDTLLLPDPDPKINFKPWIASSWKTSPDGKTYTFHLNKGLKFHNGSEITAEDVVFSLERMLTAGGPVSTHFKGVKPGAAKVIDRYTVSFSLDHPDPAFLARMTIFRIVNKNLVLKNKAPGRFEDFGDYGEKFLTTNDAGSGPYRIVSMKHGDRVVFEKFPDYSLAKWGLNSIERMTLFIIPEHVTIAAKFEKGELDLAVWSLPIKTIDGWRKNPNFIITEDISPVSWFLVMNNKKPPLDDIYVRKAIAYAFDYDTMINAILGGGKRAGGVVPPGIFGHTEAPPLFSRDLNKAKEMIKKSKYSPAQLSHFNLEIAAVAGSERFKKIALLTAHNLDEIGLKGQVKAARWTDICQVQQKPETAYPFVVCYQSGIVPHPEYWMVFFTPKGWGTAYPTGGIYYQNPKVNELMEKASVEKNPENLDEYYIEAQKYIMEDVPALVPNYDKRSVPLWRYLKGYKHPAGAQFFEFWFHRFSMDADDELYKKNHP